MNKKFITFFVLLVFCIVFIHNSNADYDVPEEALTLIEMGKLEEARKELNKFQRKQPGNPLVLFYLGTIEEDHDKALWYFKEVEILADSILASEALYRRAEIVFSNGNRNEAKGLYERLIDVYPESRFCIDAHYRLGIISLVERAPKEAVEFFNTCMELDTGGTKRLLTVAGLMECYVALEDWNRARETALDVIREKDDVSAVTPRALEVVALSWRKLGNEDNANEFTERLLKNYPNSFQAYAIREEGKRIAGESSYSFDSSIVFSNPEESEEMASESMVEKEKAKFSVQVGAYKDRSRALKMLRMLKEKGFNARVGMKTVQDTHLFVVQVDYFMTREEADEMVERVSKVIGEKAIVIILN